MVKDNDPKRTAHREAQQRRRLPPDAVCLSCPENDPRVLELHHPLGRAHDAEPTVVLCKNCHGKASDAQLREAVPLSATNNLLDRVAAILKALAAFFRFLANSLDRLAKQVTALATGLDMWCPEWRTSLPEGV
jgi:hypothetical protein